MDSYNEEEHIEDYALTLFFTKENYLKKVPAVSLRSTTSEHKLKEDDEIVQTIESTNVSELLFFTDRAAVYKMRTYDIPDSKVSLMGEYLPGLLGMDDGERVLYMVVTTDYSGMMVFTFENGKCAKVELKNYETKTNRRKLIGAYSAKVPVVDIRYIAEESEIVIMTDNNKLLCINTELIPLKATKSTQGVQVINMRKKGAVVTKVTAAADCPIENLKPYTGHSIPAAGAYIRKEDSQLSLV